MIKTYEVAPIDVQKDIDYIYNEIVKKGGRRSKNYLPENLKEPVLGVTIRYSNTGNPVAAARILYRKCYDNSVRVFDRFGLIEGVDGLYPKDYDGLIKKSSSDMIEQQTDFCIERGYKCMFICMELKVKRTLERVIKGHNKYSKHIWKFDGPHYVTYKKSVDGLQYLGYTGREFRRNDGLYYSELEK